MARAWLHFQATREQRSVAPLYHPRRPCANPGERIMMNKPRAIGVSLRDHGRNIVAKNHGCNIMPDKLNGYRILILETREEAQFSRLLAEQGADVLQCPMFTIHDARDPAPIEAWIRRAIERPLDDLVLMTGEGLRRLMKVVRRIGVEAEFVGGL